MRKHIALYGTNFCYSGGGIFYLAFIARALVTQKKEHHLKISLILPKAVKPTPTRMIRKYLGKIKRRFFTGAVKDYVDGHTAIKVIQDIDPSIKIVFHDDSEESLIKALKKIKADILLPVMHALPKDFPIPWVGGFYDMQYKYLPEFFPGLDLKGRDQSIKNILENAKSLLTISHDSTDDLNKFFPGHSCKILPTLPACYPTHEWLNKGFKKVEKKYNLPKKFFLISNQLWIHKSHITAFQALKKIKDKSIHIVCTGVTHDARFPEYFNNLKKEIAELGLSDRIHFLGYIPKIDQITIMRHAIATIQPTLFEGSPGGGVAHNAIAINTPIIVSNIRVNLELTESNVTFFKAKCPDDLAAKMAAAMKNKKVKIQPEQLI